MRVYMIRGKLNDFQHLLPADPGIYRLGKESPLRFDGRSKVADWSPPTMKVMSPKKKAPDLWSVDQDAAFAATPEAFPLIQEFFEMAGEVLPLPVDGRTLHLLNVTVCEDCLDGDRCRWILGDNGKRLAISEAQSGGFVFDPRFLPESSIFKIPSSAAGTTFCWEEDDDPLCSFKAAVEKHGLSGLEFLEVWVRQAK